jgi:outer membrane immunogenic protein
MIKKHVFLLSILCAGGLAQAGPAIKWEGAYIGLEAGSMTFKPDWKTTQTFNPDGTSPATVFEGGAASDPNASMQATKAFGSLFFGYNWRAGSQGVIGIEANVGQADCKKSLNYIPGLDPSPDTNPGDGMFATATVQTKGNAAVRGRLGYLVTPATLLFGTTGLAFQRVEAQGQSPADTWVSNPSLGTQTYAVKKTVHGLTLGVGLEQAMTDHWATGVAFGANAKLDPKSTSLAIGLGYRF